MEKVKGNILDIKLFTKLLVFVKPYNITFYGVLTSAILISLLSTLTPYLLKVVVDDYLLLKNYEGMQSIIQIMITVLFSYQGHTPRRVMKCHVANTPTGSIVDFRDTVE